LRGTQFTAANPGNRDPESVEVTIRKTGAFWIRAFDITSTYDLEDLWLDANNYYPDQWTYNGTNNSSGSGAGSQANFLSGNSGDYATYQASVNIPAGTQVRVFFALDSSAVSASGDVSFTITVYNSAGSDTFSRTAQAYQTYGSDSYVVFEFETTEAWSLLDLTFNNFTWNGTGTLVLKTFHTLISHDTVPTLAQASAGTLETTRLSTEVTPFLVDASTGAVNAVGEKNLVVLNAASAYASPVVLPFTELRSAIVNGQDYYVGAQPNDADYDWVNTDTEVILARAADPINTISPMEQVVNGITGGTLQDNPDYVYGDTLLSPKHVRVATPVASSTTWDIVDPRRYGTMSVSAYGGVISHTTFQKTAAVTPSTPMVAFARVVIPTLTIPDDGSQAPYTIQVIDCKDGAVLATRSQNLTYQVADYVFEETLTFTPGATTNSVFFKITLDGTLITGSTWMYIGSVMMVEGSATPARYYWSDRDSQEGLVIEVDNTTSSPVYELIAGAWAVQADEPPLVYTANVGDTESTLGTDGSKNPHIANIRWSVDTTQHVNDAAYNLEQLDAMYAYWLENSRAPLQVNSDTIPTEGEWLAAWIRAGGSGDIPANQQLYWSTTTGEHMGTYMHINDVYLGRNSRQVVGVIDTIVFDHDFSPPGGTGAGVFVSFVDIEFTTHLRSQIRLDHLFAVIDAAGTPYVVFYAEMNGSAIIQKDSGSDYRQMMALGGSPMLNTSCVYASDRLRSIAGGLSWAANDYTLAIELATSSGATSDFENMTLFSTGGFPSFSPKATSRVEVIYVP
jgi:hypothetical protein